MAGLGGRSFFRHHESVSHLNLDIPLPTGSESPAECGWSESELDSWNNRPNSNSNSNQGLSLVEVRGNNAHGNVSSLEMEGSGTEASGTFSSLSPPEREPEEKETLSCHNPNQRDQPLILTLDSAPLNLNPRPTPFSKNMNWARLPTREKRNGVKLYVFAACLHAWHA